MRNQHKIIGCVKCVCRCVKCASKEECSPGFLSKFDTELRQKCIHRCIKAPLKKEKDNERQYDQEISVRGAVCCAQLRGDDGYPHPDADRRLHPRRRCGLAICLSAALSLASEVSLGGAGAAAAGLGSGLADLIAGYGLYVPGTAAIKFIVALLAGLLLNCKFIKSVPVRAIIAGVVGEVFMVLGYLAYEALILGYGAAAVGGVPMNCIQGAFGVVAGAALYAALLKTKYFKSV